VELVTLAEQYFFTESWDINKLHQVLDDLNIDKTIDVLVLGCTHFPILAEPISQYFEGNVKLLDSGVAIANRVNYLLNQLNLCVNKLTDIKKPLQYYATADVFSNKLAVKLVTLTDPSQYVEH
jgi:glutamate racemase